MAIWDINAKNRVLGLINSTTGVEVVGASGDGIHFCGKAPLRTFEIICEDTESFRVKETTGFQTGVREPTPYSDQDVITQSQMIGWVTARLKELDVA